QKSTPFNIGNSQNTMFNTPSSKSFSRDSDTSNSINLGVCWRHVFRVVAVSFWISLFIFCVLPRPTEVKYEKSKRLTISPSHGYLTMCPRNFEKIVEWGK